MSFSSYSKEAPFKVVQDFFAATSAYDYEGLRNAGTDDFELLEIDAIWDIDFLIKVVKSHEGQSQRRNFFNVITQKIKGDMLLVSY